MRRRTLLTAAAGSGLTVLLPQVRAARAAGTYRFGFSQVTTVEPWRVQFNKAMRKEAAKYSNLQLIISDGEDRTEKQVADIENFIVQKVDVLLISPKESAGLTGVTLKAIDAGIPTIILDRNVNTDKYTQFIGGDNVVIGRAAGEYAVKLLGAPGKAAGNVVEIWGGLGTAPAHDRHNGFHAITDKEKGIKYLLDRQDGDWKQQKGYDIMSTALKAHDKIDLVYGHNDPMAYGAYLATKDAGRATGMKFLGIDGIPDLGVKWVHDGALTATFLYATPGAEGVRQGMKLMAGEKIPHQITLPTMTIDKSNCDAILKANGLL